MNTTNETSLTKAADPVSVFIGSTLDTSTGSVAFNGLEKGAVVDGVSGKIYPISSEIQPIAEAKDGTPVASGLDSTPTNWFELAADLCLSGRITETRMRRAIEAVRQGVERA
jgi:hypothetical protein